jgi:hypothetical protein
MVKVLWWWRWSWKCGSGGMDGKYKDKLRPEERIGKGKKDRK